MHFLCLHPFCNKQKNNSIDSKHELQARLDWPVGREAKAEMVMLYVTEFSRSGWCALPAPYVAQKLSQGRQDGR